MEANSLKLVTLTIYVYHTPIENFKVYLVNCIFKFSHDALKPSLK